MIERPARSSHPSWLEIAEARFQALKVWKRGLPYSRPSRTHPRHCGGKPNGAAIFLGLETKPFYT